ncbi:MAG: hypothetical protein NC388_10470 [Clostridium sp.]|nr:hypothetical protein [Clostridium sp.]
MKITLLQTDIEHGNSRGNLARIDALLEQNAGSRLYVLPELFATGFEADPHWVAESESGLVQTWMQQRAIEMDAALAGSVAVVASDGTVRNRFLMALPMGGMMGYDKRHLFTPGGEAVHYTCGTERVVWTLDGVRILPLVCYDLRFPVWARNRQDYDLMLVVANWPAPRMEAWDILVRARAIENQCYVAAVNRVGMEHGISYAGHSVILDPLGRPLTSVADAEAESASSVHGAESETSSMSCASRALTATIHLEDLARCRRQFPVADDADRFSLTHR